MLNGERIVENFLNSPRGKLVVGDATHIINSNWVEDQRYLKLQLESIEGHPLTKMVKRGTYEAYFDETSRCIAERTIFFYHDFVELNPDYSLVLFHADGYAAISSTPVFNYIDEGPAIISKHLVFTQWFYRNSYVRAQYLTHASYYLDDGTLAVFEHQNPFGVPSMVTARIDDDNPEHPKYLKSNIPLEAIFDKGQLTFKTRDVRLPEWLTVTIPSKVEIGEWDNLATADGNEWRNLIEKLPLNVEIHKIL